MYAFDLDVPLSVCVSVLSMSCTKCEIGKYALESGSTTCGACSDGKTTQRDGMTFCVCKPGYTVVRSSHALFRAALTVFL